jgi:dolichol-phosphate mannosyltransferase
MSRPKYTIIITALNENEALQDTYEQVTSNLVGFEYEIILATSKIATNECIERCESIESLDTRVRVMYQSRKYVAGAILDAIDMSITDSIIFMGADGETDPSVLPSMITKFESTNSDVVIASRWLVANSFINYDPVKLRINQAAQLLCRLFYGRSVTDWTFGYRLYKKSVLNSFEYKELRHPWFLEAILLPVKDGIRIAEVPVTWKARQIGESVIRLSDFVGYLRPIFRIKFNAVSKFKK